MREVWHRSWRGLQILALAAGLFLPISLPALVVTRGPYLQMGTTNAVTIRWRTDSPSDTVVRYGTDSSNLSGSVADANSGTEHEIRLTGLMQDTRYFYSVGSGAGELARGSDYYFFTSPVGDKATRIWVIGDSGTANSDAAAVRDAFLNFNGSRRIDLWLMLGDNAYWAGRDDEYQRAVFDFYPGVLRKTVVWPTLGNHETDQQVTSTFDYPFYRIFSNPTRAESGGLASGTESYYSFNYGAIHCVCLNSMTESRASDGPMATWLMNDLQQNTQEWTIVYFHHPPYTHGSHNSDSSEPQLSEMRANILPILEDYGVDLVLSGHSHSYERSYLLDGHYGNSSTLTSSMLKDSGSGRPEDTGAYQKSSAGSSPHSGVVYAVAGSSGQTSGGSLDHPAMFISLNRLGSMVLDINGGQLDAKFISAYGTTDDWFRIVKPAPAPPGLRVKIKKDTKAHVYWPSSVVGGVVEFRDGFLSNSSWQPLAGAPVMDGDQWRMDDDASNPKRYYRLRLPGQ